MPLLHSRRARPTRPTFTRVAPLAAWIAMACVPASAPSADPTSGDLVVFPAPRWVEFSPRGAQPKPTPLAGAPKAETPPASSRKVLGLHIPGNTFRAGTGWWNLWCNTQGQCRLAAARLTITTSMHPVYDSDPIESQVLSWTQLDGEPARGETLVAVFKPIRSLANMPLKAGDVTTWLSQPGPAYPDTRSLGRKGTMEVRMPVPGPVTLLVPRLQRKEEPGAQPMPGAPAADGDGMVLELRVDQQRQILAAFDTGGIEGISSVAPKQYLLWAGDLDGDGRPDYIVDLSGANSSRIAVFLSSKAKPGELVGEAGSFTFYDPSSAGC